MPGFIQIIGFWQDLVMFEYRAGAVHCSPGVQLSGVCLESLKNPEKKACNLNCIRVYLSVFGF